jgi:adenosylcobinamide-phosphate synthase
MLNGEVVGYELLAAAWLDYGMGDPRGWLHPVQAIGFGIKAYSDRAIHNLHHPLALKIAGIFLCWGTIVGVGVGSWSIIRVSELIHPLLGSVVKVVMLASCFAGRSLRRAAEEVIEVIDPQNLDPARKQLSLYVGRDTAHLTQAEIYRSVLETVTENATDGAIAPLFYAIFGMLLPSIGGVPLAMAYKAASTLDSMVGYRHAPYTDLGWCSAKLEDILTWLPCRITVLTVGLLSGKPLSVWRMCWRDAPRDPSPNSGWSECVYAAALGVQVGGINYYRGEVKEKPLLGEPVNQITAQTIDLALGLTRLSLLIWLAIGFIAVTLKKVY